MPATLAISHASRRSQHLEASMHVDIDNPVFVGLVCAVIFVSLHGSLLNLEASYNHL